MAHRLILPQATLGHFLAELTCSTCGHVPRSWEVHYPHLRPEAEGVSLIYTCRCPCGAKVKARIPLSVLLLGYLLVRGELAAQLVRVRFATTTIVPNRSEAVDQMIRDFHTTIAASTVKAQGTARRDFPSTTILLEITDVNPQDRVAFDFSQADWDTFVRRLGILRPKDDGTK